MQKKIIYVMLFIYILVIMGICTEIVFANTASTRVYLNATEGSNNITNNTTNTINNSIENNVTNKIENAIENNVVDRNNNILDNKNNDNEINNKNIPKTGDINIYVIIIIAVISLICIVILTKKIIKNK